MGGGLMRIVVDYRPALRARSGVGEYVHQVARGLALGFPQDSLTLFTSSWEDRPEPSVAPAFPGARVSDHRFPVAVLNFAWHWLSWPSVELVTHGRYDVAFSPHPLLLPSRHAAQVVMVHDLDFLRHAERTHREIRRDYPRLARSHGRRAARVIVPSQYTADEVVEHLGVARRQVSVCAPGAPEWRDPPARFAADGYVLFMGTLEPRKNVDGLLEAYGRLLARRPTAPKLVLAGGAGPEAQRWIDAISRPPLAGHVEYRGYVGEHDRQRLYADARVLVLPSHEEGFGMSVLEAMSLGIPVVASNRGALPGLVGDTGILIAPDDTECIAAALDRVLSDDGVAEEMSGRGLERSKRFQWRYTAEAIHQAFREAIDEQSRRNRRD
jgi:glycosyltransferase involved in cell wall biosynthesis